MKAVWMRVDDNGLSYSVGLTLDDGQEILFRRFDLSEIHFDTETCSPLTVHDCVDNLRRALGWYEPASDRRERAAAR